MSIASKTKTTDHETHARTIIETIQALQILMEKENRVLLDHEYDRLLELGQEKATLAQIFHDLFKDLAQEKEKLSALSATMKQDIEKAWESFSQTAQENADLLERAAIINRTVAERMVEATRAALNTLESGYSEQGTSKLSGSTEPLKLNETL